MSSIFYNRFFANQSNKIIDWEADTIKVALTTSSYTPNKAHNTFSQITNEVSGTGYTAGGATLGSAAVTEDDTNDLVKLDGADITWTVSTITNARYAIIYDSTLANDDLIACIDFVTNRSSAASDFKIQWHADGIMTGK